MKTMTFAFAVVATFSGAAHAGEARWHGMDEPYLAQVHERVHPRWSTFLTQLQRLTDGRFQDPSLAAEVVVAVEPDGRVSAVEETASAGLKGFDDAPIDLIHDVARFPAPPHQLASDDGKVYLRMRFTRTAPGCEESAVIERRLPIEQAVPQLVRSGHTEEAVARVEELYREAPEKAPAMMLVLTEQLGRVGATDRDPQRRAAATAILGHLEGAEAQLVALARDESAEVRHEALLALAGRSDSEATTRLMIDALANPGDREVAVRTLGRLGDRSAVAPLRDLLRAGELPEETATALVGLGDRETADRIVGEMLGGEPAKRLSAARAAHVLAAPALTAALVAAWTGASDDLRAAILAAIGVPGERDPEARALAVRALGDPSARVRAQAAVAVAAIDPRATALRVRLVEALGDTDPTVRAAAASSLAAADGASEDTAWEIARLTHDPAPSVRIAVGEALLAHPAKASARVLAKLLKDPDAEVRQALRVASVHFPTPSVSMEQVLGATDTVELLRAAAAWRAARTAGPRAESSHRSDG